MTDGIMIPKGELALQSGTLLRETQVAQRLFGQLKEHLDTPKDHLDH